ncbi:unnamed protein product [Effrenium voratum]|uniref:C3H1-type domain-containing protein n=1 Tax=Effrenium voratum TaxID=2562239 RepID=A0AA36IQQ8_9DINO|nr:unnamed protein product [Effrenium voratum]
MAAPMHVLYTASDMMVTVGVESRLAGPWARQYVNSLTIPHDACSSSSEHPTDLDTQIYRAGGRSFRATPQMPMPNKAQSASSRSGITDGSTAGPINDVAASSSGSDWDLNHVPGLTESEEEPVYNSVEAHLAGTCRACRFFQLKKSGCHLGDACKFCHLCTKDEARADRLRIKYEDRRAKRRQGLCRKR